MLTCSNPQPHCERESCDARQACLRCRRCKVFRPLECLRLLLRRNRFIEEAQTASGGKTMRSYAEWQKTDRERAIQEFASEEANGRPLKVRS